VQDCQVSARRGKSFRELCQLCRDDVLSPAR